MSNNINWGKKAYITLSLIVVAIIWIAFIVHFFVLGNTPTEANWTEEIAKWVVMTIFVTGIVDGAAYAVIASIAARKKDNHK